MQPRAAITGIVSPPRHPAVAHGCAVCFACAFLVVWSAGTLLLDLLVLASAVHGTLGECLFMALFSVPFNAVSLMLWGLIVIGRLRGARSGPLVGTGVRVLDDGRHVRIRLPRITPIGAVFLAAFVGPILVVLPLGFAMGGDPPTAAAVGALLLILAGIVAAAGITARRNASGKVDLVIDRFDGSLILPQTFGRHEPVAVPCGDLVGIRVAAEERTDNEGNRNVTYAVLADWNGGGSGNGLCTAKLTELASEHSAEALAALIRQELDGPPA